MANPTTGDMEDHHHEPFRLPTARPKVVTQKEAEESEAVDSNPPQKWGLDFFKNLFFCSCCSCCPFSKSGNANKEFRTVIPNHLFEADTPRHLHPNRRFAGNKIRTTKYSILSFFPKNLFEQFHRFANLYFIFVVVLNWIPQIEAFGKELSMLPVMFVMAVTAIKDAFEDFRRYKSDQKINNTTCRVWNNEKKRYEKTMWKDALVGDFVHLSCNEKIPADILMLRSSDAMGVCYVETSNLDGESNLKQRQVINSCQEAQERKRRMQDVAKARRFSVDESFKPTDFRSQIQCEQPNSSIYKFNAFVLHENGTREAINKNNLLLRGCELRNTDYIEGIVIYAGRDTKSMMNNSGPRYKRSDLERLMNWDIVWCVVILLVLCVIGAIGSGMWLNGFSDPYSVPFLTFTSEKELKPELEAFINFWSYIIILQVMIPISLYVSIEIVKLGQIFFIVQDVDLYDPKNDKKMQCRALNIPEELGQIQYVLSDKTGTLTENMMIFRRCTVAGVDYGPSEAKETTDLPSPPKDNSECVKDVAANPRLFQRLKTLPEEVFQQSSSAEAQDIFDFFVTLTICNTVVVTAHPHVDIMNASGFFVGDNFISNVDGISLVSTSSETPVGGTPATSRISKLSPLKENNGLTPYDLPSPKFYTPKQGDESLGQTQETNLSSTLEAAVSTPRTAAGGESAEEAASTSSKPPLTSRSSKLFLNLPNVIKKFKKNGNGGEKSGASTPGPRNPIYEAESPDELSLVYAAKAYGFRLVKRQLTRSVVELPDGRLESFEVLHTLPFDSVRKRMSVIVRSPLKPNPILYTKGADNVIMDLLSRDYTESERGQNCIFKSQEYLNLYASYGLRTLCLAKRELSAEEYERWSAIQREADMALGDREEQLFEAAIAIEKELELLGATGIEDRLQEGVPECIAALRHAGMKVWVLTGDKIETAVNIAYSCRLFSYGMELIQLSTKNEADTREAIERHLEMLNQRQNASQLPPEGDGSLQLPRKREKIGIVVEGRTLAFCLRSKAGTASLVPGPNASQRTVQEYEERKDIEDKFIQLISRCTSVLCCRATPSQKAHIVKLVKNHMQGKTLAIGDGANDVAMIQSADVGVGISGQEGMQAVMAADFAIGRFKFLKRLLLVHGHWCYDRLTRTVLYFFYKNAVFVFTLFWFQLFCGFSSQVIIDPVYLMLYNLVFTSLPPLLLGMFDQDAPDHILMDQPRLYAVGRTSSLYKSYSFWLNMLDALWQSIVIYFVSHLVYVDTDIGLWSFGFLIFSCLVVCNMIHLATEVKSWTIPLFFSIVLSLVVYYGFSLIYNLVVTPAFQVENPPYYVAQNMMSSPIYWLTLFFIVLLSLLPRLTVKIVSNSLAPPMVFLARLKFQEKQNRGSNARDRFAAFFTNSNKTVQIVPSSGSRLPTPESNSREIT